MVTRATKRKKILGNGSVTTISGLTVGKSHCRKCMKVKDGKDFYTAIDLFLDSNGLLSICHDCVDNIYDNYFVLERNIDKAILRTCRSLNIAFSEKALNALHTHINTIQAKGKEQKGVFGIYKSKLTSGGASFTVGTDGMDMMFTEPSKELIEEIQDNNLDIVDMEYLKNFWGSGLSDEQYNFLESEMARYRRSHKSDTATEESLLRQICFMELNIREKRFASQGQSPNNEIKMLQELMKTASVDPAKSNIAGAGKSQDTFSSFIKIIEETEPADFYKDKQLFKDVDNIEWYFRKFVTRPLSNFLGLTRNFDLNSDDDNMDIEDDTISEIIQSKEED